jgi:hypothetical protein
MIFLYSESAIAIGLRQEAAILRKLTKILRIKLAQRQVHTHCLTSLRAKSIRVIRDTNTLAHSSCGAGTSHLDLRGGQTLNTRVCCIGLRVGARRCALRVNEAVGLRNMRSANRRVRAKTRETRRAFPFSPALWTM